MYSITDLKKGTLIDIEGIPYQIVDYSQKVMGRGGSIVNIRIKSLLGGKVLDKTFKGNDKVAAADVETKPAQFLYADGKTAHFMDVQTFEQFELSADSLGDSLNFLPEGASAKVQLYDGQPIGIDLPAKVPLKVVSAPEVVKGDTQSTVLKEVTLETGYKIQTPIFIKSGETIIVDTRSGGSYVERAKK